LKDKFTVHILCFLILLILSLEVEVIKRLLWPLNEPEWLFKNGKKQQKIVKNGLQIKSLIAPTILELEKSL